MLTSEFLLPLGWIVDGGFLRTLAICLAICPGSPQLLGLVFDGYWVPWSPRYQFLAFVPGNPCLAIFIAAASHTFRDSGFQIPVWVNYATLVGFILVYVALNILDFGAQYTIGQMRSATKLYHNLLYLWYGYLAATCLIAMWMSAPVGFWTKALATIPGLCWLACLVADSFKSDENLQSCFMFAHVESIPIWKTNWMPRRRTATGYEIRQRKKVHA